MQGAIRGHALPWWCAVGLGLWLSYVILGPEARAEALFNLALLLPFIAVAPQLTPASTGARQEEPARV